MLMCVSITSPAKLSQCSYLTIILLPYVLLGAASLWFVIRLVSDLQVSLCRHVKRFLDMITRLYWTNPLSKPPCPASQIKSTDKRTSRLYPRFALRPFKIHRAPRRPSTNLGLVLLGCRPSISTHYEHAVVIQTRAYASSPWRSNDPPRQSSALYLVSPNSAIHQLRFYTWEYLLFSSFGSPSFVHSFVRIFESGLDLHLILSSWYEWKVSNVMTASALYCLEGSRAFVHYFTYTT